MKFCYIDESGTGDEPIAVMVGVITDSYKMRVTKSHWLGLLSQLSGIIGRQIKEIHTRDFYSGNSPWRDLSGEQRSRIITAIFDWLHQRQHSIVYTAVNKDVFLSRQSEEKIREIGTLWRFMALHIALSIQKHHQGAVRGRDRKIEAKGSSVLIFDNEDREQKQYIDFILSPPDWTDTYYDRKPKQEKMSQIVDVPHFVDSEQVGMIQLADFICYFLRRHIELSLGVADIRYHDEVQKVKNWTDKILTRSIPKNNIFMNRGRCDCSNLFYQCAPEIVK